MNTLQLRHLLVIGLLSCVAAYYFPPQQMVGANQGFYSLFATLLGQQQQQHQQQLLQQQMLQQQQLLQQQQQVQQQQQPQWQAPVLGSRHYFDERGDVVFLLQGKTSTGYLPDEQFNAAVQVPSNYVLGYKIVQRYPHDTGAFTQGLFVHNGTMYESTGMHGQSTVRKVDVKTGEVLLMTRFSDDIFGEGITMHSDNKIYGLSWQERKGFRIDPESLKIEMVYDLPSGVQEGWGITSNGKELMVTDSTNKLHFVDTDFKLLRSLPLRDPLQNKDLAYANELEFIDGKLYANVYGLDHIAVIDTTSGLVTQWIDCRGLWKGGYRGNNAVFNGIAYNTEAKKLYVTGKNWDSLYEIELVNQN